MNLNDKYVIKKGQIYLSGIQALVKLPLLQRSLDLKNGLLTAGFISGYRGSPLGGVDKALWSAENILKSSDIQFVPGLNEDLAATHVWGSQQVGFFGPSKYDGVFGMWYGKGPGVDRSGDAIKHANVAGTSKHGGVLMVVGDDHPCKSSTFPHQSDQMLTGSFVPILNPSNIEDMLSFGLYGWAMSRFTGLWIALKVVTELADNTSTVDLDLSKFKVNLPEIEMPEGGLNIKWPDEPLEQERRIVYYRLPAAKAFVKANGLDRVVIDSKSPRIGIITCGKSHVDTMQALDDLGITEKIASDIGIKIYKIAMSWPLETDGIKKFAADVDELLVIEEKRSLIESQIKEAFYGWNKAPKIVGKYDEDGNILVPSIYELNSTLVAEIISRRISRFYNSNDMADRLTLLKKKNRQLALRTEGIDRKPYYCSGCPHNTSTRLPEGSKALAGIGCHYMAMWIHPDNMAVTHMGAEGATWVGAEKFTNTEHIFTNLGDGTYNHSGSLSIRAAVAAKINITYKILYNDAVAMTGGQQIEGLSVLRVAWQVATEGVGRIAIVSDEPEKYKNDLSVTMNQKGMAFDLNIHYDVTVHHRSELDAVQKELREYKGVSVLIYDQTCATEKRRRRKRGTMEDPAKRIFINDRVCEGCGDCNAKSNCLSVRPIDTPLGRKREIDQANCNKDYTCADGFCPSFVEVTGARLKKPILSEKMIGRFVDIPDAKVLKYNGVYNILIAGMGGVGVVTTGALLTMAAHLEGKKASVLDQTGLAQKFGAVYGHVKIGDYKSARISNGKADLLLGADFMVSAGADALSITGTSTKAVINSHETPTGDISNDPDWRMPTEKILDTITNSVASVDYINATRLVKRYLGDALAANMFLVGYAYQNGLIPLKQESIIEAIELNALSVDMNRHAFMLGRLFASDPAMVPVEPRFTRYDSWYKMFLFGMDDLTEYQNFKYATLYSSLVNYVNIREHRYNIGPFIRAVTDNMYKLMAYKDEYEVARLHADPKFKEQLDEQFEGKYKLSYLLAPPMMGTKKRRFGGWMRYVFIVLAKMKFLRGTKFDPFGYTVERKLERKTIKEYDKIIRYLSNNLNADNVEIAVRIAELPEKIRGYGHLKLQSLNTVKALEYKLLKEFNTHVKN